MASFMQIKGLSKSTPNILRQAKKGNFDEVFQNSEQLLASQNAKEEDIPSPDLTVNLKSLSSIYLDSNPKFIELKKKLELYYLDIRRENPRLHPQRSAHWKKLLYSSLHKLLNECMFTQTRSLQIQYLNKVYEWYMEKIGVENRIKETPTENLITITTEQGEFNAESAVPEITSPTYDKLSQYSRRHISSAQSLRPQTAPIETPKWLESRPTSAFKPPILAYTGLSEPIAAKPLPDFKTTFVNYQPLGEEAEIQMEKRYQVFRQKDLEEKRLRDEMSQKVLEWTISKSKRAEEQMRRNESFKFASKFEQRAFMPSRPQTANSDLFSKVSVVDLSRHDIANDVINEASQHQENGLPQIEESLPFHKLSKVTSFRKLHGKLIDTEESAEGLLIQDPNAVVLSAYSHIKTIPETTKNESIRPKTAGSLVFTRSASVTNIAPYSRPVTASMAKQVEEVYEVKQRLATKSIFCSMDDMRYALLSPEDLPPEQLNFRCFPKPGAGLLINPFIKIGGKKKKKKGKKGKKGKAKK